LLLAIAIGLTHGAAPALLVLSAVLLLLAISAVWNSLQSISGNSIETGTDLVAISIDGAEDEQKRFILRALKDLEFERSMGKISDEDYEELKRTYREQAKEVLRSADIASEPARAKAEALAQSYLEKEGIVPIPSTEPKMTDEIPTSQSQDSSASQLSIADNKTCATDGCTACGTDNDPDAIFCKKCGTKLPGSQNTDGENQQ